MGFRFGLGSGLGLGLGLELGFGLELGVSRMNLVPLSGAGLPTLQSDCEPLGRGEDARDDASGPLATHLQATDHITYNMCM